MDACYRQGNPFLFAFFSMAAEIPHIIITYLMIRGITVRGSGGKLFQIAIDTTLIFT